MSVCMQSVRACDIQRSAVLPSICVLDLGIYYPFFVTFGLTYLLIHHDSKYLKL
jgi:hypothetical protein